jgi:hypothetical protein
VTGPTIDDQVREQLLRCIELLQPYARSSGKFSDPVDVRVALDLATVCLSRAATLATKLI